MSETTKEERDEIRYIEAGCFLPYRIWQGVLKDADRLAIIESEVSDLADDYKDYGLQRVPAEETEERLRAIIFPEKDAPL